MHDNHGIERRVTFARHQTSGWPNGRKVNAILGHGQQTFLFDTDQVAAKRAMEHQLIWPLNWTPQNSVVGNPVLMPANSVHLPIPDHYFACTSEQGISQLRRGKE